MICISGEILGTMHKHWEEKKSRYKTTVTCATKIVNAYKNSPIFRTSGRMDRKHFTINMHASEDHPEKEKFTKDVDVIGSFHVVSQSVLLSSTKGK
ncbi:hypothetical protein CEXT_218031 [Caerostris extrusa]|uniref:Uncharacterized protein n=1 Tax=Caerostris extrusa TaxID=172846 RepID=A0AAV4MEE9_CAEEX|nr:hypothetical protein CEXT_218031 [Caerostris extrusa]